MGYGFYKRLLKGKGFVAVFLFSLTQPVLGNPHISLSGFISDNNLGPEAQSSRSVSASLGADLGRFVGISLTHRLVFTKRQYFEENQGKFVPKLDKIKNTANSLDLSLVLYPGQVVLPYLIMGLVKKNYMVESLSAGTGIKRQVSLPPVPNGGLGLTIRLSQDFSLKLTHNVSPGLRQKTPGSEEVRRTVDAYSSVGVSYNL